MYHNYAKQKLLNTFKSGLGGNSKNMDSSAKNRTQTIAPPETDEMYLILSENACN